MYFNFSADYVCWDVTCYRRNYDLTSHMQSVTARYAWKIAWVVWLAPLWVSRLKCSSYNSDTADVKLNFSSNCSQKSRNPDLTPVCNLLENFTISWYLSEYETLNKWLKIKKNYAREKSSWDVTIRSSGSNLSPPDLKWGILQVSHGTAWNLLKSNDIWTSST